jgi:hypothetical protein
MSDTAILEPDLEQAGDQGEPTAIIEAVKRKRRRPRRAAPRPAPAATAEAEAEPSIEAAEEPAGQAPATTPRRRRRKAGSTSIRALQPLSGDQAPLPSQSEPAAQGIGAWNWFALAAAAAVLVMAVIGVARVPDPAPVRNVEVQWLPGPQLPDREWKAWITSFPGREQIPRANDWLLAKLRSHLESQAAVAEVARVAVVSDDSDSRSLVITLRLSEPVLPVQLADGRKAWADAEGKILPAAMPPPAGRPPVLVGVEAGGMTSLRAAIALWLGLKDRLETGFIAEIRLADDLDDGAGNRGIVLVTRQGSRILWGRPNESQYGLDEAAKRDQLVHAVRSGGDLAHLATLNVRYGAPFLTLKP